MTNLKKNITSLVEKMSSLNAEYAHLRGDKDDQKLGDPTSEKQIKEVENAYSIRLPADYRTFLKMHNGWVNFEGDYGLLSTDDLVSGGAAKKKIGQIREMQIGQGDKVAEGGLIFFAGPHGIYCCYFDRSQQAQNDDMPVVHWKGAEEERDKSFTMFLKEKIEIMEELVEEEHAKIKK